MKFLLCAAAIAFAFATPALTPALAHQGFVPRDEVIHNTPEWKGERFADGRPKVPDAILDRMKNVTLEEAWGTLRAAGYEPVPFQQFILKIHSRCNLSCSYCYVYEMADQAWRELPRLMSPAITEMVAKRIDEHAQGHHLSSVDVILHGGEPLLAGTRQDEKEVVGIVMLVPDEFALHLHDHDVAGVELRDGAW